MTTRLDVFSATLRPVSTSDRSLLRVELKVKIDLNDLVIGGDTAIIGAFTQADEDTLFEVLAQRREARDFPPEAP